MDSEIESIKQSNAQENNAQELLAEEAKQGGNPWMRVTENCEMDSSKYVGDKDVSRMRQSMVARKADIAKGNK